MPLRTYPMVLVAIVVMVGAGMVWMNTAGAAMFKAIKESPKAMVSEGPPQPQSAPQVQANPPAQPPADLANVWAGVVTLCVLYFLNFVHNMYNTYKQYELKKEVKETKETAEQTKSSVEEGNRSLNENTVITKQIDAKISNS